MAEGTVRSERTHKVWKFTCLAEFQDAMVLEVVMETDEGLVFGSPSGEDEVAHLNEWTKRRVKKGKKLHSYC